MEMINPVRVVEPGELKKGDLVAFMSSTPILAILLDPEGIGMTWASIRDSNEQTNFFYFHENPPRMAASFGPDWCLEIIATAHLTSAAVPASGMVGQIVIDDSGPALILRSGNAGHQVLAVNLENWKVSSPPSRGVFGFDWRIWASKEDRQRPGAEPLHTQQYQPASQAASGYVYPPLGSQSR